MKSKLPSIYNSFLKSSSSSIVSIYFKPILRSKLIDLNTRAYTHVYSNSYFKYFPTKFKAFCLISGRSRGVFSNYYFSRITFKHLSIKGDMVGFKKSRW